jgi:hypothetical protein
MTTTHEVVKDVALTDSTKNVVIHAPVERIHLGKWLTQLTDAEYQACAIPDHRACGWSKNADGDLVSINVEVIGGSLMIQHYVAEVLEPRHCRMVSLSELQFPDGWQYLQVIWDLSVTPLESGRTTFTNKVLTWPTRSFLDYLKRQGISFEQVKGERQAAVVRHNELEAPHYAASVERAALAT